MKTLNGLSLSSQPYSKALLLLGVLAYGVLTALFSSHYLVNWDASQFALGTKHFSLLQHQPHPPGYYLFVKSGQILSLPLHDVNAALIAVNATAGFFALLFFVCALRLLSTTSAATTWLLLLFVTNPIAWFYRSVALTYTFEVLTALLLTFTTLLTIHKKRELLPISTGATLLLAGFRPSVVLIAFPFLVAQFVMTSRKWRALTLSAITGLACLALWLPALAIESGGARQLFELVMSQLTAARTMPVYDVNEKLFFLKSMIATAFVPLCMILVRLRAIGVFVKEKKLRFLIVALALFIIVNLALHFGEVGYLLGVIPLLVMLCAPVVESLLSCRMFGAVTVCGCVIAQALMFIFGIPFLNDHKLAHISYADIRAHDKRVSTYLEFVRKHDPQSTAVIVLRGQYLRPDGAVASYPYDDIRLLSYYLPEYKLIDLFGVGGAYGITKEYRHHTVNGSIIPVSPSVTTVVFLADYINPSMRPSAVQLRALSDGSSPFNIYWAPFLGKEFKYNGMVIRKQQSGILEL